MRRLDPDQFIEYLHYADQTLDHPPENYRPPEKELRKIQESLAQSGLLRQFIVSLAKMVADNPELDPMTLTTMSIGSAFMSGFQMGREFEAWRIRNVQ